MGVQAEARYNQWYRNGPARVRTAGAVRHDGVNVMATPIIPVPPETPQLKRCPKCGETKPRDAFSRDKSKPDGRHSHCKACNADYRAANAERAREYMHEYRAANAERIAEQKREYATMNAEHLAEYHREYYAANAERAREYACEYYAANREKKAEHQRAYSQTDAGKAASRAGNHNRRARKLAAGGTFTTADLAAIRAAQTDKRGRLICWRCGKPIKGTPDLDHWMPLKHGGRNDASNLHYMHFRCNRTKSAKTPAEIGRLI